MFDKAALIQLQQADTISALSNHINQGAEFAPLPESFKLASLESFYPVRYRPRGDFATSSIDSFKDYCLKAKNFMNSESGAGVFIDCKKMSAEAIINLLEKRDGDHSQGHCDFTATCKLEKTAAFTALTAMVSGPKSQQQIAEFCEDWLDNIEFFSDMSASNALSKAGALAAIRSIKIKATAEIGSNVQNLSNSRSAFEQTGLDEQDKFPGFWCFSCEPYQGLGKRIFAIRLSVHTGEKPSIQASVQRMEAHQEEMGTEFAALISDIDARIFLGNFNR
jgi:uncharacterized protein YfdQ (DUF2303 family)